MALWRRLTKAYTFGSRWELETLELACRQADDVARLEETIDELGFTIKGSQGQDRLNPAVTEVRLSRAAVARLLGLIELPTATASDQPADATPRTAASRRGRTAAEKRWGRVAHLVPVPAKES